MGILICPLTQLSDKQLAILESEMQNHRKSVGLAYVLLIFLGSIGVHQFYLGKTVRGIVYLVLGIAGWVTFFSGGMAALAGASSAGGLGFLGIICLTALGILILIDLFTLPKQVRTANEEAEGKILSQLLDCRDDYLDRQAKFGSKVLAV